MLNFQIFVTVASLLSSLHQLKEENVDLKDSVDQYVQRRYHLLAVRARLMALNNWTVTSVSGSNNSASTLVTTIGEGGSNPSTSSERVGFEGVGDGIANGSSLVVLASSTSTSVASTVSITEEIPDSGQNSTNVIKSILSHGP